MAMLPSPQRPEACRHGILQRQQGAHSERNRLVEARGRRAHRVGLKLIFFGGTKKTGTYFELFGIEFGSSDREPMSTFECWFVGLALIAGGSFIFRHSVWG